MASQLAGWPGRAAAGVVTGAQTGGASAIKPVISASIGAVDEPFAWASVTKLLVALASLVATEEGTVDLNAPAGPPGSTVAHLLAHASGLPFEGGTPVAPPARRRIYSNTGMELMAGHLGAAAGMPFDAYLQAGVLEPLGMHGTTLEGSPAHGAKGPLTDLLLLAREFLSPTLISPETLAMATSVAWPGLAGVLPGFGRQNPCDWGLGPEIRDHKSPHWTGSRNSPVTFGHFGQSGSFLWVDPVAKLGAAALGATPFDRWATRAWPAFSDAVLVAAAGPSPGCTEGEPSAAKEH
jgi:CubicO group peptidase (beta-lactamase class C family)